jgi:hypothetical protein
LQSCFMFAPCQIRFCPLCIKYIGIILFTNVFQTWTLHSSYFSLFFFFFVILQLNLLLPIKWISPHFHIWKRKTYLNWTYRTNNLHTNPYHSYYVQGFVFKYRGNHWTKYITAISEYTYDLTARLNIFLNDICSIFGLDVLWNTKRIHSIKICVYMNQPHSTEHARNTYPSLSQLITSDPSKINVPFSFIFQVALAWPYFIRMLPHSPSFRLWFHLYICSLCNAINLPLHLLEEIFLLTHNFKVLVTYIPFLKETKISLTDVLKYVFSRICGMVHCITTKYFSWKNPSPIRDAKVFEI